MGDNALQKALSEAKNVVLASHLNYPESKDAHGHHSEQEAEMVFSNKYFSNGLSSGFVNFIAESDQSTIRKYAPQVKLNNNDYLSFTSHIIQFYDSKAFENLKNRAKEAEVINFSRNESSYVIFEADEIDVNNPKLKILKDKIVLLGYLGPNLQTRVLEDNHFTPMNLHYSGKSFPDMYGVLIHANILSMILQNQFVNEMKFWKILLTSFIILYLHMFYFIKFYIHRHIWYHIFAKIVQLLSSVIIVGIEIYLLSEQNLIMNSSLIILPILLSIDVLYFYDGIVKYLNKKFNYQTWFLEH